MKSYETILYVSPEIYDGSVADGFRQTMNMYWHNRKRKQASDFSTINAFSTTDELKYSGPDVESAQRCKYVLGEVTNIEADLLPATRQTIQIYSDDMESDTEWQQYVLGGAYGDQTYNRKFETDVMYADLSYKIDLVRMPSDDKPYDETFRFASTKAQYNFYVRSYEERPTREANLPNLYSYASLLQNKKSSFGNNIRANGNLKDKVIKFLSESGSAVKYFEEFSKYRPTGLSENMQNLFFTSDNVKKMSAYNSKKSVFPMYCETGFTTDKLTEFSDMLNESNLSTEFVNALYTVHRDGSQTNLVTNSGPGITSISTQTMDVTSWFKNYKANGPQKMRPECSIPGEEDPDVLIAKGKVSTFSEMLYTLIFEGQLRNYVKSRSRSYEDIFSGELCSAEVSAYRVAKYRGAARGKPIQNMWFFNTGELDVIEFVDTQVNYGGVYTYVIYAYNFVLGSEYVYKNLAISRTVTDDCIQLIDVKTNKPVEQRISYRVEHNPITKNSKLIPVGKNPKYIAEVDVIVKPMLKVFEVPIYTKEINMIDLPPMPPTINIVPQIGVKDKIKIQCRGVMGDMVAVPIQIEQNDNVLFEKLRANGDLGLNDPIDYRTDDYPVQYEVYRIKEKPTSYEDFSGNRRRLVDLRNTRTLIQSATTAGAYIDKILPNTRYYYTIRCIDVHGNMSNPSPIHEIEMVEDAGAFYLVHNVIELETVKPYMVSKPMKRFLYLAPTVGQSVLNEDASGFDDFSSAIDLKDKILLGREAENLWNKNLKMRITSKKTGRKIDINLRFKVIHATTAVEK